MKKIFKRPLFYILLAAIIFAVSGIVYYLNSGSPAGKYDFAQVSRADLVQEVSVTGRVQASQSADLAFERSGRTARIFVSSGDQVKLGQPLVAQENADLAAQVAQAQAGLQVQEARLIQLRRGTRAEDLQIAQTAVNNAQRALNDAQNNYAAIRQKAEADLKQTYESALTSTAGAVTAGLDSIYALTDIQYAHFSNHETVANSIADAKAAAVLALLGDQNGGRLTNYYISILDGGAKLLVERAQASHLFGDIETALAAMADALKKIKSALDSVPLASDLTVSEKTALITQKNSINSEIVMIDAKRQAIEVQKAAGISVISSAESSLTSVQNALDAAIDQLALKQAGSAPEDIRAQEAQVNSARASLASAQAQMAKTIIRAPFDGEVVKVDAKIGEIVSPNVPQVSVLSAAEFEMEANVPEADIAKLKIGDTAKVTLDAYGNDTVFDAKVVAIEQAERIIEGVATYKTTLQFSQQDDRIKSGMTANIDIETARRDGALVLPSRSVAKKDGKEFVKILENGQEKEIVVKTGLRGSDGNVEILEGLGEGERVIVGTK